MKFKTRVCDAPYLSQKELDAMEKAFAKYGSKSQKENDNKDIKEHKKMKKVIRLTESDIHRIVRNSVKRIIKESFEDDFKSTRDSFMSRKSPNGMFGFEMKNQEGDWQYGDITYDPNTNTMSCMGVSIEVDPEMSVDANLEALYEELMNNGYGDSDE